MQSPKLPKSRESDHVGRQAVSLVQTDFERRGWIFRRQDGQTDFGIDAEIEIREADRVTGQIFKAQIKGRNTIVWSDGRANVSVKTSTYNLWKATPLPVLAFLCDLQAEQVYWALPISQVPKAGCKSLALSFEDSRSLSASFDVIEKLIKTWFGTFQGNILREVPVFYHSYRRLAELAGFGDSWSMLPDDDDRECRLFYHHLIELRLRLGLTCEHLPSIDDWYIRSAVTWHDEGTLFFGTFDELMRYIKSDYSEAIEELKRRTRDLELRFENEDLLNFLSTLDGTSTPRATPTYIYMDERTASRSYARDFDEKLRRRGALRFPQLPDKN